MMTSDCTDVTNKGDYNQQDHCIFTKGAAGSHAGSYFYPNENSRSLNIEITAVDKTVIFQYHKTDGYFGPKYRVDRGTSCYVGVIHADVGIDGIATWYL
jgi:hypothetical protein